MVEPRLTPATSRRRGRAACLALALLVSACDDVPPPTKPPARAVEAPAGPVVDPAVAHTIASGERLFFDRAACSACHRVGERGAMYNGPNLGVGDGMTEPLAVRAKLRRPDALPIEYVVESMLDPDAIVVPTFAPGVMKAIDELPSQLSDGEIVAVAAFVASRGADPPLVPSDLERAKARIPAARAARAARRAAAQAPAPAPAAPTKAL